MKFEIKFTGHKNITSNHKKTLEITRESHLTPRGDCIVGVNATAGCSDLPPELKTRIRDEKSSIVITVSVGDDTFVIKGCGHPDLLLGHADDIVIRKSGFLCPRTLAIGCDRASDLMPRSMVSSLQDPNTTGIFTISVE